MPKTGLSSEEIKNRAIHLSEQRIRKFGYEKIRLTDVAKDLGISHAALYTHFPDKASLVEEVTKHWLDQIDSELEKILAKNQKADILITKWFLTLHRLKKQKVSLDPELFKAFDSAAESHKNCIKVHLENSNRQLTKLVQLAMHQGQIKKDSIPEVVDILFKSTLAFHYPKLVAMNLNLNQEKSLISLLNVIFKGLNT